MFHKSIDMDTNHDTTTALASLSYASPTASVKCESITNHQKQKSINSHHTDINWHHTVRLPSAYSWTKLPYFVHTFVHHAICLLHSCSNTSFLDTLLDKHCASGFHIPGGIGVHCISPCEIPDDDIPAKINSTVENLTVVANPSNVKPASLN